MKKLVIFSEESIFSGIIKCGIAEVVDSLANSLTSEYEVNVVCLDGHGVNGRMMTDFTTTIKGVNEGRFLKVNYFLIEKEWWPAKAVEVIDLIRPDIFHNFYEPEIITKFKEKPSRSIYTFDDINFLFGKETFLEEYDYLTTFSKNYAKEIMKQENSITKKLQQLNFQEVSIGVSAEVFSPQNGLFIPFNYNSEQLSGKQKCKERFLEKMNIKGNPCIFLCMCRLIKEKGIDSIMQQISFFKENNSYLILIGQGEKKYEDFFSSLKTKDGVIFIKNKAQLFQIPLFVSSADFYLQPSLMETGGLMPMTASLYGAIPIVTQNGGLADNFNYENAIIVTDNLRENMKEAISLYDNKTLLNQKRKEVMTQNFSWQERKKDFIQLYE